MPKSGEYYVKVAKKNKLRTIPGKGDHVKAYDYDGGHISIPLHRELAKGTECAIRKWFLRLGIVCTLAALAAGALTQLL